MKKTKIFLIVSAICILFAGCNKPDTPPKYYTVNFVGEEINIEAQTVESGKLAVAPENPERKCFFFGGWFTDNGTFVNQWDFETNIVTQNTTLFAKWEESPDRIEYVNGFNTSITMIGQSDDLSEDSIKIIISSSSLIFKIGLKFYFPKLAWPERINMITQCEIQNDTIRLFIIDDCSSSISFTSCYYRTLAYYNFDFFFEKSGCLNYYFVAEFITPNSDNKIIDEGYIFD